LDIGSSCIIDYVHIASVENHMRSRKSYLCTSQEGLPIFPGRVTAAVPTGLRQLIHDRRLLAFPIGFDGLNRPSSSNRPGSQMYRRFLLIGWRTLTISSVIIPGYLIGSHSLIALATGGSFRRLQRFRMTQEALIALRNGKHRQAM